MGCIKRQYQNNNYYHENFSVLTIRIMMLSTPSKGEIKLHRYCFQNVKRNKTIRVYQLKFAYLHSFIPFFWQY